MIVILNGGAAAADREKARVVEQAFRACGEDPAIEFAANGNALQAAARKAAAGPDEVVVAGGGDGTLSTVAAAVAEAGKIFAVLPMGTLNHFAKDLRIPLRLEDAVRTAARGRTIAVDLGAVNGRTFLNNSSLGLYPAIVQSREAQQNELGRGKWPAFVRAAVEALRRYPFMHLQITMDGNRLRRKTVFLFVGNNEYEFSGFRAGGRSCIDAGHLGLCLAHRTGRLGIVRLFSRAVIGRLSQAEDFETFCVDEALIESRKRRLLVAIDGEVTHLETPLQYRIQRGALRVRVPAQPNES